MQLYTKPHFELWLLCTLLVGSVLLASAAEKTFRLNLPDHLTFTKKPLL